MKKLLAWFGACSLGMALGCSSGNPGGPGANNSTPESPTRNSPDLPRGNPVNVGEDNTFTLDVPNFSTSLRQGETKQISISINRRRNFDQDVALKFGALPQGVTITPDTAMVRVSEQEAKFNVRAADDAALGNFTVRVIGHPSRGPDASNDLKVSIQKR